MLLLFNFVVAAPTPTHAFDDAHVAVAGGLC
jgi:hypothetical protein